MHELTQPVTSLIDEEIVTIETSLTRPSAAARPYHADEYLPLPVELIVSDPPLEAAARRLTDIGLSLVALVIGLPIMAVIALLIAWDSPGPIIFRQLRIGRGGRLFTFYKFRTMWVDARQRFPEQYAYRYSPSELDRLVFKSAADPRLTNVGRWLRRTSLDELPNFLNVLLGHMTLVGPRPEIPEMFAYYHDDERRKFGVKPGVTGLAQVSGRAMLSFRATVAADLTYLAQRSYWYDLRLLIRTLWVVVFRVGAF